MESHYSDSDKARGLQTLDSIEKTIIQLIDWNKDVPSAESFYNSPQGMQLLAADCTLITAIGEGVNRINRVLPNFLQSTFPNIPWHAVVGMRNHIAHGYFELDADIIFEAVSTDIPPLLDIIRKAIQKLSR